MTRQAASDSCVSSTWPDHASTTHRTATPIAVLSGRMILLGVRHLPLLLFLHGAGGAVGELRSARAVVARRRAGRQADVAGCAHNRLSQHRAGPDLAHRRAGLPRLVTRQQQVHSCLARAPPLRWAAGAVSALSCSGAYGVAGRRL
jgi:hypothetical protein